MESHLLARAPWGPFHPSGRWQIPPHRNLLLGLVIILTRRSKFTLPYSTPRFSFQTGTVFSCRKQVLKTRLRLCPFSAPSRYLLKPRASWCHSNLLSTTSRTNFSYCQHTLLKTIKLSFHFENFSWCHYYLCTPCKALLLNIPAMNK